MTKLTEKMNEVGWSPFESKSFDTAVFEWIETATRMIEDLEYDLYEAKTAIERLENEQK